MLARRFHEERLTPLYGARTPVALTIAGLLMLVGLAVGSETSVGRVVAVGLATATTMTALAAWLGLRRLILGLGMVATAMAPWVGVRAGHEVAASDVVILAAILVAAVYRLTHRRFSFTPYVLGLIAILLVVAGGLLGTFFAPDPMSSLFQLARFSASTIGIVLFFALLSPTRREVVLLAMAFVLGTLVSAGVGMLFIDSTYGRPVGLSLHSNHLGLVVFMAIGIMLGLSRSGDRQLVMGGVVVLAIAAVYTGSRASLVGLVCTGIMFLWATRRLSLLRRVLIAMAIAVAAWTVGWISIPAVNSIGRALGDDTVADANAERADVVSASVEQIQAHPVTGSGFGSALEAHSIYLQLWQGGGVLALIGLTILWIVALRALRRGRQRRDELLIGLAASYIAYLVVAAVGNQLWDRYLWVIFSLMIAARAAPDLTSAPGGSMAEVTGGNESDPPDRLRPGPRRLS